KKHEIVDPDGVGANFPVGLDGPLEYRAGEVVPGWKLIQHSIEGGTISPQVFLERYRLRVICAEDEAFVGSYLREWNQSPLVLIQVREGGLVVPISADQATIEVIGPSMQVAHELRRVAFVLMADAISAVA